MMRGQKSHKI